MRPCVVRIDVTCEAAHCILVGKMRAAPWEPAPQHAVFAVAAHVLLHFVPHTHVLVHACVQPVQGQVLVARPPMLGNHVCLALLG